MKGQNQFGNIIEDPETNFWDDIHRHLKELSSDEIIDLYYRLRDACTISGREVCYPNIQHLHATPFEREKDRREQRQWIQILEEFMKINAGRFVFLYFGTAQSRRGYDIVMNMAARNNGCFIHCGLRNEKEKFPSDLDKIRMSLDKRGALLETNQFIEDPLCVETFFKAATHLILPYRDFYGSSGVMLQALSYGIPVLSPRRGIIGHRIDKYGLGLTYNDNDPADFEARFQTFRNKAPESFKESIESYMTYQTSSNLVRSLKEILSGNTESVILPNL